VLCESERCTNECFRLAEGQPEFEANPGAGDGRQARERKCPDSTGRRATQFAIGGGSQQGQRKVEIASPAAEQIRLNLGYWERVIAPASADGPRTSTAPKQAFFGSPPLHAVPATMRCSREKKPALEVNRLPTGLWLEHRQFDLRRDRAEQFYPSDGGVD
jgi:hypothetical protein